MLRDQKSYVQPLESVPTRTALYVWDQASWTSGDWGKKVMRKKEQDLTSRGMMSILIKTPLGSQIREKNKLLHYLSHLEFFLLCAIKPDLDSCNNYTKALHSDLHKSNASPGSILQFMKDYLLSQCYLTAFPIQRIKKQQKPIPGKETKYVYIRHLQSPMKLLDVGTQ